MNLNYNKLYIIGVAFFLYSCGTEKKVEKPLPKIPLQTNFNHNQVQTELEKPKVEKISGYDFFKVNIGNSAKNDNTISYGSIVSANPSGYEVIKNFFPAIGQNFRQRYVILHYTALNTEKSAMVLTQQSVSSHYLVNDADDKEIYQLVDEDKRAYHAGVSQWRNDGQLNDTSIGIEIVNAGYTMDSTGMKVFPEYPDYQFKKVAALVKDIVNRYNIPPTNILGHSDIAPTRKQDPGPKFPWKRLYDEYQLGMWYDEAVKQSFYDQALAYDYSTKVLEPPFVYLVQTTLRQLGYGVELSGTYDKATQQCVEAFQYHFRPTNYSGSLDAETWSVLQALAQKYPSK